MMGLDSILTSHNLHEKQKHRTEIDTQGDRYREIDIRRQIYADRDKENGLTNGADGLGLHVDVPQLAQKKKHRTQKMGDKKKNYKWCGWAWTPC